MGTHACQLSAHVAEAGLVMVVLRNAGEKSVDLPSGVLRVVTHHYW